MALVLADERARNAKSSRTYDPSNREIDPSLQRLGERNEKDMERTVGDSVDRG